LLPPLGTKLQLEKQEQPFRVLIQKAVILWAWPLQIPADVLTVILFLYFKKQPVLCQWISGNFSSFMFYFLFFVLTSAKRSQQMMWSRFSVEDHIQIIGQFWYIMTTLSVIFSFNNNGSARLALPASGLTTGILQMFCQFTAP
jgi:hypothetical protein